MQELYVFISVFLLKSPWKEKTYWLIPFVSSIVNCSMSKRVGTHMNTDSFFAKASRIRVRYQLIRSGIRAWKINFSCLIFSLNTSTLVSGDPTLLDLASSSIFFARFKSFKFSRNKAGRSDLMIVPVLLTV